MERKQARNHQPVYNERLFSAFKSVNLDLNIGKVCEFYSVFNTRMDADQFVSGTDYRLHLT